MAKETVSMEMQEGIWQWSLFWWRKLIQAGDQFIVIRFFSVQEEGKKVLRSSKEEKYTCLLGILFSMLKSVKLWETTDYVSSFSPDGNSQVKEKNSKENVIFYNTLKYLFHP